MHKDSLRDVDDRPFSAGNADSVEVEFRVLRTISDRARLLLSGAEDLDVEFRKSMAALRSEDLVAFANSKNGGAILIGVTGRRSRKGERRAALAGCAVGDRDRRKILAEASQCMPPVPVSIFVENGAGKTFCRIEIAPGRRKPYCTAEGIYRIRNNGRNEALYPHQLLTLFPQADDGEEFSRFGQAAASLGCAANAVRPRGAMERRPWSRPARELQSHVQASPRISAADHVRSEKTADEYLEGAEPCSVRLSSQDLCGFLMRL